MLVSIHYDAVSNQRDERSKDLLLESRQSRPGDTYSGASRRRDWEKRI